MNIFCKVINNEVKAEDENPDSKEVMNSISDQDLQRLYAVEFKSQSYSSFYNTTMEKDKSILTLSVAGIGFLITLLKLSDSLNYYDMLFFVVAAFGFLVSIFCIITLFGKNADFIVDLAQEKDVTLKQYLLKRLDFWALKSFYLAIIMSLFLGVSTSSTLFLKGERKMAKDPTVDKMIEKGYTPSNESYQGATALRDSAQGTTNLQPATSSTPQNSTSSQSSGAAAMMPNTTTDKKSI